MRSKTIFAVRRKATHTHWPIEWMIIYCFECFACAFSCDCVCGRWAVLVVDVHSIGGAGGGIRGTKRWCSVNREWHVDNKYQLTRGYSFLFVPNACTSISDNTHTYMYRVCTHIVAQPHILKRECWDYVMTTASHSYMLYVVWKTMLPAGRKVHMEIHIFLCIYLERIFFCM